MEPDLCPGGTQLLSTAGIYLTKGSHGGYPEIPAVAL
jgi:hypothetical protein